GLAEVVGPVDAELTGVVDAGAAAVGQGGTAGVGHRARRHEGAAAAGGLAGAELAGGVDHHADAVGLDAQLLDRDLEGDGVHALAHLGPAVAHLDGAVVLEAHDRAADLDEAVAEAGVLEAEPEADGLPG